MKYAQIDKKTGEILNVIKVDTNGYRFDGNYLWIEVSLYNVNVGDFYENEKFWLAEDRTREIEKEKEQSEKVYDLEIQNRVQDRTNEAQKEMNTVFENVGADNTEMLVDLQYQMDVASLGGMQ